MITTFLQKAVLGAGLALVGLSATADTLKIGTEGGYPPWSMVDASGKVSGFDADVGNALCKELNADCRFVVQAFDSLIPSLDANRFDLIISGMSVTPERAKRISFSIPYAVEDAIFVLPKDSALVNADSPEAIFKGLAGKTVGVQGGTTHGDYLRAKAGDLNIKNYDTLDQMQIDLDAGRLDATFADLTSQSKFLHKVGDEHFALSKLIIKGSSAPETLGYGIGVGINKNNAELKEKVDAALCKLINDGTIKTSSEKWFDIDISNYEVCKK
ncbi:transporter substrate-binding domain-containing protein [Pollutimonas harenae]|uniref:Transporter substrate-binding domain-containing protein n=1 Tax=Pollutimonas harenae TaxID=657015 RepID=A0A853GXN5_9BURK|nr:transporter substrate-binding domain-containing protein [Pollutimonas harenae]NYT84892.1 transporter substrate-binding domain-containing protein [Pollutimonas harenae]TEA72710.1 transporter substrate-binding domain-containing protein [Pollutimonas harenae]